MDNKKIARAVLCKKSRHTSNDRISQLPDELLLTILSLLPVKDAVVACMVSPRWRNLWKDNIWCLNLEIPEKGVCFQNLCETLRHTVRVNKALELHCGPYLEELRIGVYAGTFRPTQVHSWINFAICKGVKKFELKLVSNPSYTNYRHTRVDYFARLLDDKASERQLHHPCQVHTEKHQFRSFCCLKSLSLAHLNISNEPIHYILSNCMFLEFLRVKYSKTLLKLEVADGLRLKCLEIVNCSNIRSLKIYTRNLESLVYLGPKIDVPFQNAPLNLLKLTVGFGFGESFALEHGKHRFYLSQLKTLRFKVPYKVHTFLCHNPLELPEIINLRHLELQVPSGKSLLGYMMFFKAAPFLSTFKLTWRLFRSFTETEAQCLEQENCDEKHRACEVTHQHLQKVVLVGFFNISADIEFSMHLISILEEDGVGVSDIPWEAGNH